MQERIQAALEAAFSPAELTVTDDSEDHRGHAGYREGGGTHFSVRMRAAALDGMNRVAQQRAVMKALKAEFDDGLHALALDLGGVS